MKWVIYSNSMSMQGPYYEVLTETKSHPARWNAAIAVEVPVDNAIGWEVSTPIYDEGDHLLWRAKLHIIEDFT